MTTDTTTADDENESKPRKPVSPFIAFIEQTIITLGLYVLSIGPMYWVWFDAKYVDGPYVIAAFYEPLWHVAKIFPSIGDAINWYVSFWV